MLKEKESRSTIDSISIILKNLGEFLKYKNRNYGDSALKPIQVFSKLDAGESINIRIDDKLNRILNSKELRKNDTLDLVGYLILKMVEKEWLDFTEFMD